MNLEPFSNKAVLEHTQELLSQFWRSQSLGQMGVGIQQHSLCTYPRNIQTETLNEPIDYILCPALVKLLKADETYQNVLQTILFLLSGL